MTDEPRNSKVDRLLAGRMDRRRLLKTSMGAGAALAIPSFLAACGSAGEGTEATGGGSAPGAPGGRFRFALSSDSTAGTFDPARETIDADGCRRVNTFDALMALRPDHTAELRLAESVEPSKDLKTWTVRLRDGVLFHDGKKCTADDLIYSVKRILDPRTASGRATFLGAVDPKRLRKLDPLTVQFNLTRPDNNLPLAFAFTEVVQNGASYGSFKTHPIGTGPFKVVSVNMGTQVVWERFDEYWHPDQPRVEALEMTVIPDASARMNALTGGQVDAIERVPPVQFSQLAGTPGFRATAKKCNAMVPLTMRADTAPLSDPNLRRALRLIADRAQLIEASFSGRATLANDLYGQGQPLYAADIPQREQDLEEAKFLLKKVDLGGSPLTISATDAVPGELESATAFVQQASEAGLSIKLRKVPAESYYGEQWPYPFGVDYWADNPLPQFFQLALVKGAPFPETAWSYPGWQKKFEESSATADEGLKKELYHDMQKALWDSGGYLQWSDSEYLDGLAENVNGISNHPTYPLGGYDFRTVTVR